MNSTPPSQQSERFLIQYVTMFQSFGYNEAEASRLARDWLPDVLAYNYTLVEGYPNGRRLMDDVVDDLVSLMTRGKTTTDLVGPHTDYLVDFPYLGPPHPPKSPT